MNKSVIFAPLAVFLLGGCASKPKVPAEYHRSRAPMETMSVDSQEDDGQIYKSEKKSMPTKSAQICERDVDLYTEDVQIKISQAMREMAAQYTLETIKWLVNESSERIVSPNEIDERLRVLLVKASLDITETFGYPCRGITADICEKTQIAYTTVIRDRSSKAASLGHVFSTQYNANGGTQDNVEMGVQLKTQLEQDFIDLQVASFKKPVSKDCRFSDSQV